jgi:branched-chain amino acid transport system ATP-binding protein
MTDNAAATVPQLNVRGIDVFYGASQILFGVDLMVERGTTVALLGRNGAGKSTTFKAIAGVVPPRSGSVSMNGQDITGLAPYRIARRGIGYVPEDRQIFPEHSVEDNLTIAAKPGLDGQVHWTLDRIWKVFPALQSMRTRMGGRLSGGEQQMLTIARALMGNPDVVLLDEPSEGLAPIIVVQIAKLIGELRAEGVTILLAEQNMHFCIAVASSVAIIDKGQIVYRGTVAELKQNQEITKRYLAV